MNAFDIIPTNDILQYYVIGNVIICVSDKLYWKQVKSSKENRCFVVIMAPWSIKGRKLFCETNGWHINGKKVLKNSQRHWVVTKNLFQQSLDLLMLTLSTISLAWQFSSVSICLKNDVTMTRKCLFFSIVFACLRITVYWCFFLFFAYP